MVNLRRRGSPRTGTANFTEPWEGWAAGGSRTGGEGGDVTQTKLKKGLDRGREPYKLIIAKDYLFLLEDCFYVGHAKGK